MFRKSVQILGFVLVLVGPCVMLYPHMLHEARLLLALVVGAIFHYLAPYTSPQEMFTPSQLDRKSSLALVASVCGCFISAEIQYARYLQGFPWQSWTYIGVGFAALGLALRAWTTKTLGRYFTTTITLSEDHTFITHGPYAFVRHPAYLATLMIVLGVVLVFESFWGGLVYIVAVVPAYVYRTHLEEALMARQFPESYADHAKRTKQLVPFLY